MEENTNKAVSLENLGTFKAELDASIEKKLENITPTGGVVYATEEEIKALFAEPTAPGEEGETE